MVKPRTEQLKSRVPELLLNNGYHISFEITATPLQTRKTKHESSVLKGHKYATIPTILCQLAPLEPYVEQ